MRILTSRFHIQLIGSIAALTLCACPFLGNEVEPEPVDAGTAVDCVSGHEGCPCSAGGACLGSLVCENTRCVPPESCEAGQTGCSCDDGACASAADECIQGLCLARAACDGELGCACIAGACDDGLRCGDGVCRVRNGLALDFAGGDARACDILIVRDGARALSDIVYPAGFRGQARHRGDRTAIALVRTLDEPLVGTAATLLFDGSRPIGAGAVTAIEATCYDSLGAETTGVTVSVR